MKITLENGTEVKISKESYDALVKATKKPNYLDLKVGDRVNINGKESLIILGDNIDYYACFKGKALLVNNMWISEGSCLAELKRGNYTKLN
jgi:hypothetical protein